MALKDVCCPEFNPKHWDNRTLVWKGKKFIKGTTPTFFHIPFPPLMGRTISKMCKQVEGEKAMLPLKDWLLLMRDPSPFTSELFLSTTRNIPDANNVTISGTFFAKVFDGPYNAVPKWIKELDSVLAAKGKKAKDYYVHYAYCPKCSEKYGHNYAVVFAQI